LIGSLEMLISVCVANGDGITGNDDGWNKVVRQQCKGKRGKEVTFADIRKQSKKSNGASSFDG
jgi:hypothetical protein